MRRVIVSVMMSVCVFTHFKDPSLATLDTGMCGTRNLHVTTPEGGGGVCVCVCVCVFV